MTHCSPRLALLITFLAVLWTTAVGPTSAVAADGLMLAQPGKYSDAQDQSHGRTEDSMRGKDWGLHVEIEDFAYLWEGPIDGERTRQMMHEIVHMVEWTLANIEFPDARAEARLLAEAEVAHGSIDSIPPEVLDVFAEQREDALRTSYRSTFHRTAELGGRLLAHAGEPRAASTVGAPAKSGGFPEVIDDLPQYPDATIPTTWADGWAMYGTNLVQTFLGYGDSMNRSIEASLCDIGLDGGRADRMPFQNYMSLTVATAGSRLSNEIINDICGGISFDVIVISAGYNCDLCCTPLDLSHGLQEMVTIAELACEDLIDSAEIEAAYHFSRGAYEGTEHLHEDLGDLESLVLEVDTTTIQIKTAVNDIETTVNDLENVVLDINTTTIQTKTAVNDVATTVNDIETTVNDIDATTVSIETTTNAVEATVNDIEATTNVIETTTSIIETTSNEILNVVSCKVVPNLLRGHGCDGVDSDCSGIIDDCSEDVHAPHVQVDPSFSQRWYADSAEAEGALSQALTVIDDCLGVGAVAVDISVPPDAELCDGEAEVTATDACGNFVEVPVQVRIDGVAPVVVVSVARPQLFPANGEMAEVGFDFEATDGCGAVELAVLVTSDEGPVGARDAEIVRDLITGELLGIRLRAARVLGPADLPPGPGNGRVYSITLIATDAAGNTSRATTQVTVPLSPSEPAVDDGQVFDPTGGFRANGPVAFNQ